MLCDGSTRASTLLATPQAAWPASDARCPPIKCAGTCAHATIRQQYDASTVTAGTKSTAVHVSERPPMLPGGCPWQRPTLAPDPWRLGPCGCVRACQRRTPACSAPTAASCRRKRRRCWCPRTAVCTRSAAACARRSSAHRRRADQPRARACTATAAARRRRKARRTRSIRTVAWMVSTALRAPGAARQQGGLSPARRCTSEPCARHDSGGMCALASAGEASRRAKQCT